MAWCIGRESLGARFLFQIIKWSALIRAFTSFWKVGQSSQVTIICLAQITFQKSFQSLPTQNTVSSIIVILYSLYYFLSCLGYCCDKRHYQKKLGRSFILVAVCSPAWRQVREGTQYRNLRQEQMQRPWRNASYWLSHSAVFKLPRTTRSGVAPHRVGWTLPHQPLSEKILHKLVHWPIWGRSFLSWGLFHVNKMKKKSTSTYIFYSCIYFSLCVCMCVCMYMYVHVHMRMSHDTYVEVRRHLPRVSFLVLMYFRDWTQDVSLGKKCPYNLSYLANPWNKF